MPSLFAEPATWRMSRLYLRLYLAHISLTSRSYFRSVSGLVWRPSDRSSNRSCILAEPYRPSLVAEPNSPVYSPILRDTHVSDRPPNSVPSSKHKARKWVRWFSTLERATRQPSSCTATRFELSIYQHISLKACETRLELTSSTSTSLMSNCNFCSHV